MKKRKVPLCDSCKNKEYYTRVHVFNIVEVHCKKRDKPIDVERVWDECSLYEPINSEEYLLDLTSKAILSVRKIGEEARKQNWKKDEFVNWATIQSLCNEAIISLEKIKKLIQRKRKAVWMFCPECGFRIKAYYPEEGELCPRCYDKGKEVKLEREESI